MNYKFRQRAWLGIAISALLLIVFNNGVALSGSGYTIDWFEVNSGAVLTGGDFRLTGVAGQPDVGAARGGTYKLGGGFLAYPNAQIEHQIFLPLVLRNH